ncbi:hypothetical protein Cs7R123_33160 [Catellatospora sp. TT07R-123]|uniref:collagen-binding domain-containing protein n=1 Tax=Catellatospora sp. TT07R-123 TaxID=2733863 RepID=UPI001B28006D|nr:collagen-binding domain-containing protein [Catellatospora sp. TT07R-123]GHJ45974.1 hypothetical protein Cs7R123_33160 [Catellatospora sp. TT07R-123]
MRAAVAAVLSMVIGLAPSPRPSGGDFAHSAQLSACVATVRPQGEGGEQLASPYPPGTRAVVRLAPGQTNVLWLTAADLDQIEELSFEPNPTFGGPLLINVDTRGVGYDFAWTVPRLPTLTGPDRDLLWHFPDALRLVLSGPLPSGLIFAPRADVVDASASPSPSPPPAAHVVPGTGGGTEPGANAHVVPGPTVPHPAPNAHLVPSRTERQAGAGLAASPAAPPPGAGAAASPTPSRSASPSPSPSPSAAPSPSASPSASPSPSPSPSPSAIPATRRFPYPLDLICDRSPRPVATPTGDDPGTPDPGLAATPSATSEAGRMLALVSQPVTWFGVALLLVGLALLIGVLAARAARR